MKPYYEHAGITIYHGDCREVLPSLCAAGFDAAITDPQYGVGENYASGHDDADDVSLALMALTYLRGTAKRVALTKRNKASVPVSETRLDRKFFISGWCWRKSMGLHVLATTPVLWARSIRRESGSRPDSYTATMSAEKNGHPCPKPIDQWKWLIGRATLEGETVVDPFFGSGTTGRACKDLGRHCIGIEIEERYCEIAAKRLSQEVFQF